VEWSGIGGNYQLASNATLVKMAYASGSNLIYAVDSTNLFIWVYGDTLTSSTSTATPTLVSPASGIVASTGLALYNTLNSWTVPVSWNSVPGAWSYSLLWDTRPDFQTATMAGPINAPVTYSAITVPAGATIYWMVRVNTPLYSPWSAVWNFMTELAIGGPNAPVPEGAIAGGTLCGGYDAPLHPVFQWSSAVGATGYEFQLSKDVAFTNLIVDHTGDAALGNINTYVLNNVALDYSTTYYWKVRAISATSYTDWCPIQAFTTMDKPTTAPPPVTITQQAAPQITVPLPATTSTQIIITQPATKEINPTYIWAIIIIGAVLVIAVVVLIVRTRRSV